MSNSFNNSKKCVMQQSLHITAKYTTSLAETLLFILVTLYRLSILFQCHLFIYLLILYIDYHTIESNMNHGYKTNFPWKKKSWGNKSYPWMCIQKSFSQFQIIFILPWSITADMLSLQKEQTNLYKSHINSDRSLAAHGSVPNASKLNILGKGNKVSHRGRQSRSDPTGITDNTKLRIKFPT